MNVLSLFDGMSCGQQALERAGFKVDNYFASEIDKYGIQVTMANYPNTKQIGSVIDVDGYSLPKIDLLIGGSPCQSFSFAGKRKGMSTKDEQEILTLEHYLQLKKEGYEFEGQSYLFWEYMRLLKEVKPKYFLLENVMMGEKWEKILNRAIGVNPIEINSSLVSAQNRRRLYWTNIGMRSVGLFGDLESIIEQPKDKGMLLKDILQDNPNAKYYLSEKIIAGFERHKERHENKKTGFGYKPKKKEDKANALRANAALCPTDNMLLVNEKYYLSEKMTKKMVITNQSKNIIGHSGTGGQKGVIHNIEGQSSSLCATDYKQPKQIKSLSRIRRLTPIECERLQTISDNYTSSVSDSQRYKMLGNGWTVDVIAHIFSYLDFPKQ
jgi:DNA (cytosine-5)-methyltransferase 3A